MKKYIFLCFGGILLGIGILRGYYLLQISHVPRESNGKNVLGEQSIPHVTVLLNEENHSVTYADISAATVFDALSEVTTKHHIAIKIKQYDFGVFIESINGKESGKDYAWLYFVNGKAGYIAADKKTVKTGDTVEWRYMKPTY